MSLVNMIRTGIVRCLAAKATAATERKQHKLDIHVDQNDPAVMRLALANSRNATEPYAAMGDVCDKPHADNPIPAAAGRS
jgi:hypothetical protein